MFCNDQVSVAVFVCVSLFSMSSWINVIGHFVELPLMVNKLPEKWSLPSYMVLVIQCSNIAPALYSIISKIRSFRSHSRSQYRLSNHDTFLSVLIICISILAAVLTSLFWDETMFINGSEKSLALLVILGGVSLASCTTALVYLPYMARYPAIYLSAFYFGQGLSGLVPGLLGLSQGLGSDPYCANKSIVNQTSHNFSNEIFELEPIYPDPKFSIETFFLIIAFMLTISLASFYFLNCTRLKNYQTIQKGHFSNKVEAKTDDGNLETETIVAEQEGERKKLKATNPNKNSRKDRVLDDDGDITSMTSTSVPSSDSSGSAAQASLTRLKKVVSLSKGQLIIYLIVVTLLNMATNGIIPATQSYTCLPYGNMVYTLTVRLSSVVGPVASMATMFLPEPGLKITCMMTTTGIAIVVYHLVVAYLSPQPPLVNNVSGPVLIVVTALVMTAFFSFSRVSIASKLHRCGGRRLLLWCGGVTQLGSFIGAMLSFALINWFHIFKSISPCS